MMKCVVLLTTRRAHAPMGRNNERQSQDAEGTARSPSSPLRPCLKKAARMNFPQERIQTRMILPRPTASFAFIVVDWLGEGILFKIDFPVVRVDVSFCQVLNVILAELFQTFVGHGNLLLTLFSRWKILIFSPFFSNRLVNLRLINARERPC